MFHQVDNNDLQHARRLGYDVVGWVPQLHADDGRPYFNTTQFVKADGSFVSIFHVKPVYYETTTGHWRPLSEITSHQGNKNIVLNEHWRNASIRFIDWLTKRQALFGHELLLPTPFGDLHLQEFARPVISIGLTTTTVYPDPDTETTTCDGAVGERDFGTWSAIQTSTDGEGINDSATFIGYNIGPGVGKAGNGRWIIDRGHTGFDTSSIGSDTIDSATYSIQGLTGNVSNNVDTSFDYIFPTASSPASNTGLATTDFDDIGDSVGAPTQYATAIDITSISTASYNDFTLNASGEANINTSGVSNFGIRSGDDQTAAPIPAWSNNQINRAIFISAETTGTSTDPKLVVEHSASASADIKSINGVANV